MKVAAYAGTRNLYPDMVTAAKSLTKNSSVDIIYFLIEDSVFPEKLPDHIKCIDVSDQKFLSLMVRTHIDKIAGECGLWFFDVCSKCKDPMYQDRIRRKKHDDDFFRYFMTERHADMYVTNLVPNIVDHIDYLIGGTLGKTII